MLNGFQTETELSQLASLAESRGIDITGAPCPQFLFEAVHKGDTFRPVAPATNFFIKISPEQLERIVNPNAKCPKN